MEPLRQHVYVRTPEKPEGVTSCPSNGSFHVLQALERELGAQGLDERSSGDHVQLPWFGR